MWFIELQLVNSVTKVGLVNYRRPAAAEVVVGGLVLAAWRRECCKSSQLAADLTKSMRRVNCDIFLSLILSKLSALHAQWMQAISATIRSSDNSSDFMAA